MLKSNPVKFMATLYTYTCPAGKSFPVVCLDKQDGKITALAIGSQPLEISMRQLELGVVLSA